MIVAPEGASTRFVRRMLDPFVDDIAVRVEHVGADPIELDIRPFDGAGDARARSGPATTATVRVEAVGVHHEPVPEAVAYRIETPDRRRRHLRRHPGLRRGRGPRHRRRRAGARGLPGDGAGRRSSPARPFETIFDYHADTVPLGAMAERAGVPHVVLTHLIPPPDAAGEAEAFAEDLRDGGYPARSPSART